MHMLIFRSPVNLDLRHLQMNIWEMLQKQCDVSYTHVTDSKKVTVLIIGDTNDLFTKPATSAIENIYNIGKLVRKSLQRELPEVTIEIHGVLVGEELIKLQLD